MEEKKKPADFKPKAGAPTLNIEELKQKLSEFAMDNKRLSQQLAKAEEYIAGMQTQNLFTYVSFLFKVMEHAEMYTPEFVEQCVTDVQVIMTELHKLNTPETKEGDGDSTDEAE